MLAAGSALLLGSLASAQAAPADEKSGYTLFNPTPRESMREIESDRPDITETPKTVDAGHVQVELGFVDVAYNDDDGIISRRLDVLPTTLKLGLLNNVEASISFTPFVREWSDFGGDEDSAEGFGDAIESRVKINLWGNDQAQPQSGDTALAVIAYVRFPSGPDELRDDRVEGGLIFPLQIQLPDEFRLGLMAEFDAVDNGENYGFAFVHTANISREIPGLKDLEAYVEYIGIAPDDTGDTYQAHGGTGLIYKVNDDWLLDAGATFGISDSADDVLVTVGTTFRF
jgi:hypothetical protein